MNSGSSPAGGEIPLADAARMEHSRSPTRIERTDGRRTRTVTADVDLAVTSANEVIRVLEAEVLPGLMREMPGLSYRLAGEQQEQVDALSALGRDGMRRLQGREQ